MSFKRFKPTWPWRLFSLPNLVNSLVLGPRPYVVLFSEKSARQGWKVAPYRYSSLPNRFLFILFFFSNVNGVIIVDLVLHKCADWRRSK